MRKYFFLMALISSMWFTPLWIWAQMDPHRGPMPDLIWGPTYEGVPDVPIWVAADRVLTENGEIDREILTNNAANWIRIEFMRRDRDYEVDADKNCLALYSPGDHHNTPDLDWQDFSSVLADSKLVVLARVTGTRAGFNSHGHGVSVLRLRPLQWLKGEEDWKLNYLQIPLGRLSLAGRDFCMGQAQFSQFPELGSRVVVAYNPLFRRPGFRYIAISAPRVLTLPPGGAVSLPRWVRKKHPEWSELSDSDLVGELRSLIQKVAKR